MSIASLIFQLKTLITEVSVSCILCCKFKNVTSMYDINKMARCLFLVTWFWSLSAHWHTLFNCVYVNILTNWLMLVLRTTTCMSIYLLKIWFHNGWMVLYSYRSMKKLSSGTRLAYKRGHSRTLTRVSWEMLNMDTIYSRNKPFQNLYIQYSLMLFLF